MATKNCIDKGYLLRVVTADRNNEDREFQEVSDFRNAFNAVLVAFVMKGNVSEEQILAKIAERDSLCEWIANTMLLSQDFVESPRIGPPCVVRSKNRKKSADQPNTVGEFVAADSDIPSIPSYCEVVEHLCAPYENLVEECKSQGQVTEDEGKHLMGFKDRLDSILKGHLTLHSGDSYKHTHRDEDEGTRVQKFRRYFFKLINEAKNADLIDEEQLQLLSYEGEKACHSFNDLLYDRKCHLLM